MSETASINLNGSTYEMPVITGTEDEKALDISKLRDSTGYITLDPGFKKHWFYQECHYLFRW
ncbi:Citrate synthase [Sphingobacterium daejeonense]|nr:Citrate synthase [Sphingobacterium daejeonense]